MAGAGGLGGVGGMGGSGGSSGGGMGGAGGSGGGGMGGAGGGPTCVPNTGKSCYSGPQETENIGKCKGGATLCQADGMSYGPCLGEVTPIIEECHTPDDDDCNGVANDHCGIWAVKAGNTLEQRANAVATDKNGNVVITGRMFGSADFGGGVLTSAGGYDIFVAKFDNNGVHLWSKIFGGTTDDEGLAIAMDLLGNVFVGGTFTGSITLGAANYTSVDLKDAVVFKLDSTGQVVASRAMGGTTDQAVHGIATDTQGDVIVTGSFSTQIDTGAMMYTAVNSSDGFIAKYGPGLSPIWSKAFGGSGGDEGTSVVTDAANQIYLGGRFSTKVDFGGGAIMDAGGTDVFVAKFQPDGTHLLSKSYGGTGNQYCTSIALGLGGTIFLHGEFDTNINMGGGDVVGAGLADTYVTKLDATGNHVFTKTYGDPLDQIPHGMTVDATGDVIATISLEGTVDFGGGPAIYAGPAGSSDVVVFKLNGATGDHLWSRRFGAINDQDSRGVAVDPMNNIFVTGELGGTMNLGPVTITASSSDDAFLFKLPP